nr:PKD-like domain-containing protein [Mucilaginibacter sp. L294]
MGKTFTKGLFFLLLPLLVITAAASAQTITVGAIDPGPYGQGSSITLPFHIDNTSGCIAQGNTFKLVLSNAAGSFAAPTVLSTKTGFYETFLNGVIPATALPGTGYRLRIESTSAGISLPSNPFTISAVGGVTAGVSSQTISNSNPEVFGVCAADIDNPPPPYDFTNTSTAGSVVTAVFFNEFSQAASAPKPIPTSFTADLTNYTVIVRAQKGAVIGTKSYTLINNTLYYAFGGTVSTTVCLGSQTPLTYTLPLGDDGQGRQQSFKYNYPGLVYNVKWGDGSADDKLTFCEISAAQGKVSHVYTESSCGHIIGTQRNVFQVDFVPISICQNLTPFTGYAKVLTQPTNSFSYPQNACTNTPATFSNTSDPGQDPNNNGPDCKNADARYRWSVTAPDGTVFTSPSLKKEDNFVYTFPTHGSYTVTLKLVSSNGLCTAVDVPHQVCVQDKPQPNFTIPAIYCLADVPLTPVNTSVVDEICNTNTTYKWVQVGGPTNGVTFNAALKTPTFTFNSIGVYQFRLDITTLSCGTVTGPVKQIVVNTTPTATLSPNTNECGKGVTLSFDPTAVSTKTTFDGTAQASPTTYTWTVTSPDGGTSSFATGSTANSQYPRIVFNDYATYNISVTHTNNCGTVTKTQQLKFAVSPMVSAGPPQPNICEGSIVNLTGSPGVGGLVTGVKWTSPTGGVFSTPNSPNTTYTPTAADITNGQVMLTYTATTSLAAPCNQIPSTVLITIIKKATVTSSPTPPPVCSGTNFNYTITAANPATTFNWTTALTSGTATGFGTTGSGNTINDLITNNGSTDAIVTYTITPTLNGCPGTPFSLKLTVHPLPDITAVPVDAEICSNQPANITLTSNVNPTTYTWTFVATNGITGATNHSTPITAASIQDVLVNNSGASGTVTYTITPYNGTCPGPSKQAVVTVKPAPKQSVPGPDEAICISSTYTLKGNDPSPGTGKWTVASGQAGITFSDNTDPHAVVSGLLPGQIYKFTWTITAAPSCPPTQNTVTITNNAEAVGGTTAGTTTVCAPTNSGQITLSGYIGNIIRWESSVNNGTSWLPVVNTTATLNYSNLTQTTQYRAVISGGSCGNEFSTVTIITVTPPPPLAHAGTYAPLCNQTSVQLTANNPGTFVGKWTQVDGPTANIVIADPSNPQTLVTGLTAGNTYKFQWTIFANAPCTTNNSDVATIVNGADVTPDFTSIITQVCGPQGITFTNTSTPDLPGTQYLWDFGDGSTSTRKNPTHAFQPNADGTDVIRTVSLTITNSCTPHPAKTMDITVSPTTPVAVINPSNAQACGSLSLTVQNQSPGTNKQYDFYLVDENGVEKGHVTRFDKTAAVFPTVNIPNIARWHVYMQATNNCDVVGLRSIEYPIDVAPSNVTPVMSVKNNQTTVCLGSPVTFLNLTANATIFSYRIYNDAGDFLYELQAGPADYNYIFPNIGKYKVSISASNTGCGAAESGKHSIEVVPLPQPDFTFTIDVNNNVTFVNTTPDAGTTPAASLTYKWDFGDGSAADNSFTPAQHFYSYEKSPYTVALTATAPGSNCSNIKTHAIEIKFTGELFLPNAFQPEATKTELRTFKAKGQKLKEWRMQIFNKWGQLIWQTTQLDSNGEPVDGWDGTFKGAPAQQGVYIWQITAKFLNGADWKGMSYNGSLPKRSGTINLIR